MQVSILIVNYNVKHFLAYCLKSVAEAISGLDAEVIVVDNASSDGSEEFITTHFPWVKWKNASGNLGFAKANNIALSMASGEYIVYLNPDTIIPSTIVRHCLSFFQQRNNVGFVGVKMLDGSGNFLPESKRSIPTPMISFYKLCGLASIFPKSRLFGKYALGYLTENEVHQVPVLAGAFMMAAKENIVKLKGFDEQFFMYGEDIDISYRMEKLGLHNYYLGNTSIIHFKGESTKRGNLNYIRIFYSAMILFVKKHYNGAGAWWLRSILQLAIIARALVSAITNTVTSLGNTRIASTTPICFTHNSAYSNEKNLPEAVTILLKNDSPNLLLAINTNFTFTQAIAVVEQKKAAYFWYYSQAKAIIGSNHKNKQGTVIVLSIKS